MFLSPKILEEHDSRFSGKIKVVSTFGYKYIATGILTQSGGLVKQVWEEVLKKYGRKQKTWLILGLAGGTIAKYVSDRLDPEKIVGVEIDPIMIDLGKRFLDLNHIPTLEIVNKDALKYVNASKGHFDYVLVDMYFGDQLPEFVYDPKFLAKLNKLGNIVIFNHLFYDPEKRAKAEMLVAKLNAIFSSVTISRKLTNLLVVCISKAI